MSMLAGGALNPNRFFSSGNAVPRGSSFDLTIGSIFDPDGKKVDGPFRLKPGHMVQVVSAETFNLPATITGHVTYKTAMTRSGIWALTVGIVDPGWNGPVTTTLLNFSRVDHAVKAGDTFLRVSFFEHAAAPDSSLPKNEPVEKYLDGVQKTAMTQFPPTFLNTEAVAEKAGENVLERIRKEALVWVGVITFIFGIIQLVSNNLRAPAADQIEKNQSRLDKLEAERRPPSAPVPLGEGG